MATVTPPRCQTHDVELQPDPEWKGRLLVCPVRGCDVHHLGKPQRQPKLPGLDPGRQSRVIRASEAALVNQWCQWGGLHGYEILRLAQDVHYLTCPACRKAIRSILCPHCEEVSKYSLFSGNTTGAPDTLWTHPSWRHPETGTSLWKGLEAKKDEHAPVRTEQARLAALGYVDVVWTLEMVMAALKKR